MNNFLKKSNMNLPKWMFALALAGLFIAGGCDKENGKNDTPNCLKLFDINGSPIGTWGDCNGNKDWEEKSLSGAEKALLSFDDALPTVETGGNLTFSKIFVFPNPIPKGEPLAFAFEPQPEEYKVKIVVADASGAVYFQSAWRGSVGNVHLLIDDDFEGQSKFYKVLYRYYSDNEGTLMEGSGWVLMCDALNIASVEGDCL
ncbi:MAG: hypothetical protein D6714_18460 [Bacteroidetes bacterium]|nr:MAG: hypothetical protein D6714_18460 [Bacteroidota bacterium]